MDSVSYRRVRRDLEEPEEDDDLLDLIVGALDEFKMEDFEDFVELVRAKMVKPLVVTGAMERPVFEFEFTGKMVKLFGGDCGGGGRGHSAEEVTLVLAAVEDMVLVAERKGTSVVGWI